MSDVCRRIVDYERMSVWHLSDNRSVEVNDHAACVEQRRAFQLFAYIRKKAKQLDTCYKDYSSQMTINCWMCLLSRFRFQYEP